MAAITTTPQNIAGDFDLAIRGTLPDVVVLYKSIGSGTTNWIPFRTMQVGDIPEPIRNIGTNSYKIDKNHSGITVEFGQ